MNNEIKIKIPNGMMANAVTVGNEVIINSEPNEPIKIKFGQYSLDVCPSNHAEGKKNKFQFSNAQSTNGDRVPDRAELTATLMALRFKGNGIWNIEDIDGNEHLFVALEVGETLRFWSSTEYAPSPTYGWYMYVYYNGSSYVNLSNKAYEFSVRCVR